MIAFPWYDDTRCRYSFHAIGASFLLELTKSSFANIGKSENITLERNKKINNKTVL
jgi:hypothetical protein